VTGSRCVCDRKPVRMVHGIVSADGQQLLTVALGCQIRVCGTICMRMLLPVYPVCMCTGPASSISWRAGVVYQLHVRCRTTCMAPPTMTACTTQLHMFPGCGGVWRRGGVRCVLVGTSTWLCGSAGLHTVRRPATLRCVHVVRWLVRCLQPLHVCVQL
jgi:hypothetical protein